MALPAPAQASSASRRADASTRWDRILAVRPDLEPAVSLQRRLIGRLLDVADRVEQGGLPRLSLPPRYLAAKLGRGVPALSGEPVPLPVGVLKPTLLLLCDDLAAAGAGDAAGHIKATITETRLDAGSLLTASLARDQRGVRAAAVQHDLSADLLWLVAELAVSPFAFALQRVLFATATLDPRFAAAVEGWPHGYCPACGSWPALAEVPDGTRVLRCSFCALAWDARQTACAYCGESGDTFTKITVDAAQAHRGIEACGGCGSYLKTVEVGQLSPFPLLAIADLETMDLDAAAMGRGFRRPALRDFRKG